MNKIIITCFDFELKNLYFYVSINHKYWNRFKRLKIIVWYDYINSKSSIAWIILICILYLIHKRRKIPICQSETRFSWFLWTLREVHRNWHTHTIKKKQTNGYNRPQVYFFSLKLFFTEKDYIQMYLCNQYNECAHRQHVIIFRLLFVHILDRFFTCLVLSFQMCWKQKKYLININWNNLKIYFLYLDSYFY